MSETDQPNIMLYITGAPEENQLAGFGDHTLFYEDLTAAALARHAPSAVVCQLFTERLDAIMVLRRLCEIGFAGRCVVIAPKLPQRGLVLTELRAEAGSIVVELIDRDQVH